MMQRLINDEPKKRPGPATLADVATASGVSISAVSAVLNNKYKNIRVSEETRVKVRNTADMLGYRPNIMARGLRTNRSRLIGVVIPDLGGIIPQILQGIEDAIMDADCSLILCTTNNEPEREEMYVNMLFNKKVDGIIVCPNIHGGTTRVYRDLADRKFPCVFVARVLRDTQIPFVNVNGNSLGYQGTSHLIGLGHRRIAYFGIRGSDRCGGYRQALGEHGIPVCDELLVDCTFGWESGYRAAKLFFERHIPCTAVYAHHDDAALGVLAALGERGVSVPRDISLVGTDDTAACCMVKPFLTTAAQPKELQGKRAVNMLMDLISGKEVDAVSLEPSLIVRESTGPVHIEE